MITYQVEKYEDCIGEIKPSLNEHYEELSVTKTFPLDPDWDAYVRLSEAGSLKVITCRKDGVIVGYMFFLLHYNLHYRTMLTAIEDLYYLRKEERKGRVGIKLFKYAEEYLKSIGVNRVLLGTKVHLDNSRLFEYLGYSFVEKMHSKMI
jgi:GNAT superfamily N-acetyltransferase